MSITIISATHAQAAAPPTAQPSAGAPPSQSTPRSPSADTVQISAAARALQETIETPAQTAKEAAGGDAQARRLLAKESADRLNSK